MSCLCNVTRPAHDLLPVCTSGIQAQAIDRHRTVCDFGFFLFFPFLSVWNVPQELCRSLQARACWCHWPHAGGLGTHRGGSGGPTGWGAPCDVHPLSVHLHCIFKVKLCRQINIWWYIYRENRLLWDCSELVQQGLEGDSCEVRCPAFQPFKRVSQKAMRWQA